MQGPAFAYSSESDQLVRRKATIFAYKLGIDDNSPRERLGGKFQWQERVLKGFEEQMQTQLFDDLSFFDCMAHLLERESLERTKSRCEIERSDNSRTAGWIVDITHPC